MLYQPPSYDHPIEVATNHRFIFNSYTIDLKEFPGTYNLEEGWAVGYKSSIQ